MLIVSLMCHYLDSAHTAEGRAGELLICKIRSYTAFTHQTAAFFVHETADSWETIILLKCRCFPCWHIHHSSCVCLDNQWEEMSSSAVHPHELCWRLLVKVINHTLGVQLCEPSAGDISIAGSSQGTVHTVMESPEWERISGVIESNPWPHTDAPTIPLSP